MLKHKFNLKKCNINYKDINNVIGFINKIILKQYGLKIKKSNSNYFLTDNDIWKGISREDKIKVKKLKSNVRLDNDVFKDEDDLDV